MYVTVTAEGLTTPEEQQRVVEIEQEIRRSTRHVPNYVRYNVLLTKVEDKYNAEIAINTFGKTATAKAEGDTINLAVAHASETLTNSQKKKKKSKK